LTSTFAPAIAADGSLYFMHPAPDPKRFQLFRAQFANGTYSEPQALPFSDDSTTNVDPAVAPDESFMVFGSGRAPAKNMDLFIVFRKKGVWGTPIHMGDIVNSPGSDAEARLTSIASQVTGDLTALSRPAPSGRDGAFLGRDLAASLGVQPGELVRLIIARPNVSPLLTVPRSREFEVLGTFETGFYEYDTTRIYVGLEQLRRFMGLGPGMATAVEARIRDPRRLSQVAAAIQGRLGQEYYVNDLVRMNRTFFSALRLEKLAMSISIGLIILVAALNIVSILVLMVMEKVRDIGVLAAMGASAGAIRRIFALQGLIIAGVGTLTGAVLGVVLAWSLDRWRLVSLPADVYFIPYVPFRVRPLDVAAVVATAPRVAAQVSVKVLLAPATTLTIGALVASTRIGLARRIYILSTAALMTFLVGVSRVVLGVHWATDVLGGWAFGAAWAMVWLLLARRLRSAAQGVATAHRPH